MKVKLLKKVRKRFEILYYPEGVPNGSDKFITKFSLKDKTHTHDSLCHTKEQALNIILERLQYKYKEYSRKYKQQQLKNKPVKVWYGINKI